MSRSNIVIQNTPSSLPKLHIPLVNEEEKDHSKEVEYVSCDLWIASYISQIEEFFRRDKFVVRLNLDAYESKHRISVFPEDPERKLNSHVIVWFDVPMWDPASTSKWQLLPYFEKFRTIWKLLEPFYGKCKILVNCAAGINRSAFVIGCILALHGHKFKDIMESLREANIKRKENVLWNEAFREIIYQICKSYRKELSVEQIFEETVKNIDGLSNMETWTQIMPDRNDTYDRLPKRDYLLYSFVKF